MSLWDLASVSKRLDPLFHNCWGRKSNDLDLILKWMPYFAASMCWPFAVLGIHPRTLLVAFEFMPVVGYPTSC